MKHGRSRTPIAGRRDAAALSYGAGTCTRMPSTRESRALTTTRSPSARRFATSTVWPRSRPSATVRIRTLPSPSTTAIRAPVTSSLGENAFEGSTSLDEIPWEFTPERGDATGVIVTENCICRRCHFVAVGFAGPTAMLDEFRKNTPQ